ncbi:MAG: c-type cytochrome [Deltaproteobacteria bacterium]|nr:c-type cytochrome [Deltaproteobacteria bacterium]
MKNFLKVLVFSIGIIAFYATFSNYGIPQIKPSPPPTEEALPLGAMTMDQFITLGERLFNGKGTCTLCHNPVGGRAPLLDTVASISEERLKDSRYKGKATNSEEYIRESMTEPSAFVVAGFGVKGTNDTQSPMTDVRTGAIGLSNAEIDAVVAFLQKKAGIEVTVKIPAGAPPKEEKPAEAPAVAKTVDEAVTKFGCGACHKIGKFAGPIGPDLTKIGAVRKEDYIRRAILEPDADIAKECPTGPCLPGMMPKDYKDKMMASELEMLVKFMRDSR